MHCPHMPSVHALSIPFIKVLVIYKFRIVQQLFHSTVYSASQSYCFVHLKAGDIIGYN